LAIYTIAFPEGRPLVCDRTPFQLTAHVADQFIAYLVQEQERLQVRGEGIHTDIAPPQFHDRVACTLEVGPDGRGTLYFSPRRSAIVSYEATRDRKRPERVGKRAVRLPGDRRIVPILEQTTGNAAVLWGLVAYLKE
jgi:hypothetical protein